MRDFVVDIEEPVFVFHLTGYSSSLPVDETPSFVPVEGTGVVSVIDVDEILLLRAAAQEALNQ